MARTALNPARDVATLEPAGRITSTLPRTQNRSLWQANRKGMVTGHTYVSLAREGEGSHFIVLRVDQVASEFVALTYAYR